MALPVFDKNNTISEIYSLLVEELKRGKHDKHHPFKTFVLSTVDAKNEPQSRYVVLRDVLEPPLQCIIFTDERSSKVTDIYHQPICQLVYYHPGKKLQLRVHCQASIHIHSDLNQMYAKYLSGDRRDYTTALSPGSPLDQPTAYYDDSIADQNFTVISLRATKMDALQLSREGHLRVGLSFHETGRLAEATWLVP